MFVRFTAACLIAIGLLDTGLYVAHCFRSKNPAPPAQSQKSAPGLQLEQVAPVKVLPVVLNSVPLLAGVVALAKSKAIADWISEKLE